MRVIQRLEFGDVEGHPFHGNQWTDRSAGNDVQAPERTPKETAKLARKLDPIFKEFQTIRQAPGNYQTHIEHSLQIPPPDSLALLRVPQITQAVIDKVGVDEVLALSPAASDPHAVLVQGENGSYRIDTDGYYGKNDSVITQDDPVFKEIAAQGVIFSLGDEWNHNVASSPYSNAMQDAVATEFGIHQSEWSWHDADPNIEITDEMRQAFPWGTNSKFSDEAYYAVYAQRAREADAEGDQYYAQHGDALNAFVRATYDETQNDLKARGIETVPVVRGVGSSSWGNDSWVPKSGETKSVEVESRALSSWSTNPKVADKFGDMKLVGEVPREKVFSMGIGSVGTPSVKEVVLLGGTNQWQATRK